MNEILSMINMVVIVVRRAIPLAMTGRGPPSRGYRMDLKTRADG